MKYNDYIEELKKLPHRDKNGRTLADAAGDFLDIWSNYACVGYCKLAMSARGLDGYIIDDVVSELEKCFNKYSVDVAEHHYYDIVHDDGSLVPF